MKSLGVLSPLYPSPAVDLTSPKRAKAQLGSLQSESMTQRTENLVVQVSASGRLQIGASSRRIAPNFNLG
jgi:hypothetical protein